MKKNRIVVVFSSHLSDEENKKFIEHINQTIGVKNHDVICYPNFNEYSLSEIYNRAIDEHNNKNTIMVFCHNDIILKTRDWGKVLLGKFNKTDYQILGVAGSTYLPESAQWWQDRTKMVGIVEHSNGYSNWVSEYSTHKRGHIEPTILIDGLFMAVDCTDIEYQFDESFKGFHFYDVGFCFPNYLAGCNIGVTTDISVLHKSIGETNEDWDDNRKYFIKKYAHELPLKHVSEDGNLKVLICCQFFQNYTGSEVSNYELAKELKKLGCDVTVISGIVGNPIADKAKKAGVKVYDASNAPGYVVNDKGQLQFIKNEVDFDIIHINHKPIGQSILQMYPNIPAVMHIRSEVIPKFEEPIINPIIKKYITVRESITDYVKEFGISKDKILLIDNPFDSTRFNTDYKQVKNEKEVVLFVGTLDYLRELIIRDQITQTKELNQELWLIGADSNNLTTEFTTHDHVKYLGIKSNVEEYIKKCDYTVGIFKGRTTIEGFLCGKPGWIYKVDKTGTIINKELTQVPKDVKKYRSDVSALNVLKLYRKIINETWF